MPKLDIDNVDIDELEETFLDILPEQKRGEYQSLGSSVEQLQFIIDLLKDSYLPFFDNDMEMEALLDEIDILVDVNDDDFELSSDIVNAFVELANHVRQDDTHQKVKDRMLIILTHTLELVDEL